MNLAMMTGALQRALQGGGDALEGRLARAGQLDASGLPAMMAARQNAAYGQPDLNARLEVTSAAEDPALALQQALASAGRPDGDDMDAGWFDPLEDYGPQLSASYTSQQPSPRARANREAFFRMQEGEAQQGELPLEGNDAMSAIGALTRQLGRAPTTEEILKIFGL